MQIARFVNQAKMFSPDLKVYGITETEGRLYHMPILAVGYHLDAFETPPETFDENHAVELFTDPWPTVEWWASQPPQGEPLTVAQILAELATKVQGADLRVAIPTDQGHHRVMAILGMGFSGDREADAPLTLDLSLEPWEHTHPIIRINLRPAGI